VSSKKVELIQLFKKVVREEKDARAKHSLMKENTGKLSTAAKIRLHHILSLKLILSKKQYFSNVK
jgi:hypothetical protein